MAYVCCQEMHDLYARHNVKQLQKEMFRKEHFPRVCMNPQEANYAYLRGEVELFARGRLNFPLLSYCLFEWRNCLIFFDSDIAYPRQTTPNAA